MNGKALAESIFLPEVLEKFRKKRYTHGEVVILVLKVLAISGFAVAVLAMPGLANVLQLFQPKDQKEKNRLRRTIKNLHNRKVIRISEKGNNTQIEITEKGKRLLLAYDLEHMNIPVPKRWDCLWRVVLFDIPETKRRARGELNFRLRDIGFEPLQKSAFVFPYECEKEIKFISEYFGVQKQVKYLVVRSISDDEELRKQFQLG